MNKIQKAWEDMRISYQKRYADYCRKYYDNPNDKINMGHLQECSYVLIELFGLSAKQVSELEKFNYIGLTNNDLENEPEG